jgi:hypothetical protein
VRSGSSVADSAPTHTRHETTVTVRAIHAFPMLAVMAVADAEQADAISAVLTDPS